MTGRPLAGATVTCGTETTLTDREGLFRISAGAEEIMARAPGYGRKKQDTAFPPEFRLKPLVPRAVYLSFYGAGSGLLRGKALELLEGTELNALVIDVKGDLGMLSYPSEIPLAGEIGAQEIITLRKLPEMIQTLKEKGIYLIARIVAFKDERLAEARPELAVRTAEGEIWKDGEGLSWTDPFRKEVWEYNIEVAVEAARSGFDEIQFDYVRFPDRSGLAFSQENTEENRVAAINGFLAAARRRLVPYNVFLSADIFGYVCWNHNDTWIGQQLETLAPLVDYISPMLYPSGFQHGVASYRPAVEYPFEIVYLTLEEARERTGLPSVRFRPWLQAFRDYAFDRRRFEDAEIRAQTEASEEFGANGWMLWNPRNVYSAKGLKENFNVRAELPTDHFIR